MQSHDAPSNIERRGHGGACRSDREIVVMVFFFALTGLRFCMFAGAHWSAAALGTERGTPLGAAVSLISSWVL